MLSRIFGLVRDILFAQLFGTSLAADAFNLAYRLPTFLRRVFGEGVMNAAFIPTFTQHRIDQGEEESSRLASQVFWALSILLGGAVLLAMVAAPWLVALFARGWAGEPEKLALTTHITRLIFPYVFLVGLAVLVMGMLFARRRFLAASLSSTIFSLGWVAGAVVALTFAEETGPRLDYYCYGLLAGSLGQFLVQLPALRNAGITLTRWRGPRMPELRIIGNLMLPGIAGLAVVQINSLADTIFATLLPTGAVTALSLGNRVMLLPLAIFATAVSSAALPALSNQVHTDGPVRAKASVSFSLRFLLFFLIPSTVGLWLLARPIIRLLFLRGEFDEESLTMTAAALGFYAIGLIAFGCLKAVAPYFFSMRDTRTPVVAGAVAMVVNIIMNAALYKPMGVTGLALATSVAGFVNLALLLAILARRHGWLESPVALPAVRMSLAALFMVPAIQWISPLLEPAPGSGTPAQLAHVGGTIGAGLLAYGAASLIVARDVTREVFASLFGRALSRR
ncbi:MAG: murein biosynthesis integral membrane protein MurJ [Gemmatimonadetes bacterium]|nr:murein biosynthesis integral membrane protein MurJ [Gemmatimonadota bacterium]